MHFQITAVRIYRILNELTFLLTVILAVILLDLFKCGVFHPQSKPFLFVLVIHSKPPFLAITSAKALSVFSLIAELFGVFLLVKRRQKR